MACKSDRYPPATSARDPKYSICLLPPVLKLGPIENDMINGEREGREEALSCAATGNVPMMKRMIAANLCFFISLAIGFYK